MTVDLKSTPLKPLALQARVVQFVSSEPQGKGQEVLSESRTKLPIRSDERGREPEHCRVGQATPSSGHPRARTGTAALTVQTRLTVLTQISRPSGGNWPQALGRKAAMKFPGPLYPCVDDERAGSALSSSMENNDALTPR